MRLGVPALVRRDLERLSDLIDARHRENSPGDDPGIDRIVLYIDDLDRCPTSLVVNVLQAVHLLLSFPLFVVVIAVDARWVAHSLRDHYRQLEGEDASPEDFIEKIFQVPFWVRPLTPTARKSMIRGLIAPSLAPERPADTTPRQDNATPAVPEADMEVFEELVASFGDTTGKDPEWLADAALTVSRDELTWMERVAPLLGNTPRAIKRFANIYLLLRSIGRGRGWPVPPGGELVVLLAIGTNLPHLAERMFSDAVPDKSLKVAAKPDDSDSDPERTAERARLSDWLVKAPEARIPDGPRLDDWVELIRRFRFSRVEQPLTASSAG
jgi:hypothetical protein